MYNLVMQDSIRYQCLYYTSYILRRMMVSWKEIRTNEVILSMVQEERCMMSTLTNRQKNWMRSYT